ncbi:MAG: DoxX family protein [Verrucomicrobiota bacterium]
MADSNCGCGRCAFWLRAVLRIAVAILFMQHGGQKLFNYPAGHGTVPLQSLLGVAGILELGGGALVLVGLFTRPVAFILSGQMAFAYFMAHAKQGFWPVQNGGELAVVYCLIFLYLSAAGAGALSLDCLRKGRKPAA